MARPSPPGEGPESGARAPAASELDRVRSELRRLGYLNHRFERFFLQDALRPHRPWLALAALAGKVGALAGVVLAVALAFALAAANGNLAATPFDLVPLFLHLFPPIALGAGLAFLVLCAALVAVLMLSHVRRIERLSLGAALAAGGGALAVALWRARDLIGDARPWHLAVLAVATPLVIYALVRLVYNALLSLAILLTDLTPQRRLFSRRWLGLAILGGSFLLVLPTVLAAGRTRPGEPPSLPSAPGDRVVLIGVDGVLPEELDYLLARGELPALAGLAGPAGAGGGGRMYSYRRPPVPPAALWTSVATGVAPEVHGVTALDSFRPLGVATPLARSGPLRHWWGRVEVPLGLAEHRPVLSNRRLAFAVWELASRGGAPVTAVDWWGTFPAEPLPGLVVAHGAYTLLAEGAAGAVAPEGESDRVEAARTAAAAAPPAGTLTAALPPAAAAAVAERALTPDRFYRRVFAAAVERLRPRAAALYLPGLDLAADGWTGGDVAFADLIRGELGEVDRLAAAAVGAAGGAAGAGEPGLTVAVVLDPGRRGGAAGRVLLWRSGGCGDTGAPAPAGATAAGTAATAPRGELVPEQVAAALVRALGLPQSAELPEPPAGCAWPAPPAEVATFGSREHRGAAAGQEGGEYLESLRSLGYL